MIPRIIHYCWFGRNPKPALAEKCMKSWETHCPDYEIIEWNEDNFDLSACPLYVRQAYEAKKWAFVTDYVRLKVVYDHGGIYMDTDVELLKAPEKFLSYSAYFGFEDGVHVATGLGFGAEKEHPVLKELMDDYDTIAFVRDDNSVNYTTCGEINTHVFENYGLQCNNKKQLLKGDILILPTEYLCPVNYHTDILKKTRRTVSIHWFAKSWMTEESRLEHQKRRKQVIWDYWIHLPNRVAKGLLGESRYEALKAMLKK